MAEPTPDQYQTLWPFFLSYQSIPLSLGGHMFMDASPNGTLLYSYLLLLLGTGACGAIAVRIFSNEGYLAAPLVLVMYELPLCATSIWSLWWALYTTDSPDIAYPVHLLSWYGLPIAGYLFTAILLEASWALRLFILGTCWTWWISLSFQTLVSGIFRLIIIYSRQQLTASWGGPTVTEPSSTANQDEDVVSSTPYLEYYQYKPLLRDQIRLLRLYADNIGRSRIHCELQTANLDSLPSFEAISYTWGSSDKPSIIVVHEDDQCYYIPVTMNAHSVLRNRSSRTRLVWIDSICINQDNSVEKTQQVSLMRHIYQRASRVIVWLGDVDANEARNAKSMLYEVAFLAWFYKPQVVDERLHARYTHHWDAEPLKSRWQGLINLYTNPYWGRLWIVQEIALARTVDVVYGDEYLSWSLLTYVMFIFIKSESMYLSQLLVPQSKPGQTLVVTIPGSIHIMPIVRKIDNRTSDLPTNFVDLVSFSQMQQATDPRDKVFGFLGLLPDDDIHKKAIHIDYSRPVTAVYADAARCILAGHGVGQVLSDGGIGVRRSCHVDGLPSWLPDWSMPAINALRGSVPSRPYLCGGMGPAYFPQDQQPQATSPWGLPLVKFAGFVADTVDHLGSVRDRNATGQETMEGLTDMLAWFNEARNLAQEHGQSPYAVRDGTTVSSHEAFWRTLILDRVGSTRPAPVSYGTNFRMFIDFLIPASQDLLEREGEGEDAVERWTEMRALLADPETAPWLNRARKYGVPSLTWTRHRRFCVSTKGYLALVPELVEQGDLLCVVAGYPMPVLLRRMPEEGCYVYVGETYVHGWMDGEPLSWGLEMCEFKVF